MINRGPMTMTNILYAGNHLDFVECDDWEFVQRRCPGVVAIVAVTENDELVLIEQYRTPVGGRVVELPAGLAGDEGDAGEDPAIAARRELIEETGFDASSFVFLSSGPSSAGLTSEVVRFYLARGLTHVEKGGGIGGEEIAVYLVPLGEVRDWLSAKERAGVLIDPKIPAGLWMAAALG